MKILNCLRVKGFHHHHLYLWQTGKKIRKSSFTLAGWDWKMQLKSFQTCFQVNLYRRQWLFFSIHKNLAQFIQLLKKRPSGTEKSLENVVRMNNGRKMEEKLVMFTFTIVFSFGLCVFGWPERILVFLFSCNLLTSLLNR